MFLTWLIVALLPYFPEAEQLLPLDLEDHITASCKLLLQTMAPASENITPRESPTIIIQAPQCTYQDPESKKDTTPEKRWDMQQLTQTHLCHV